MQTFFHGWRRMAACVTLVMECFAIAAFLRSFLDPFDDDPFSRSAWMRSTLNEPAEMAHDLIVNHIRHGMTGEEVVAMLGSPNEALSGTYVYWLGQLDGFTYPCWDDAFLPVDFDANGRVVRAEITGR